VGPFDRRRGLDDDGVVLIRPQRSRSASMAGRQLPGPLGGKRVAVPVPTDALSSVPADVCLVQRGWTPATAAVGPRAVPRADGGGRGRGTGAATLSGLVLLAATVGGLPTSLDDRWEVPAASVAATEAPTASVVASTPAAYELPSGLTGPVVARLTFGGAEAAFDVTVEGVPVTVDAIGNADITVEQRILLQDGSVTVSVAGAGAPSLLEFDVIAATTVATAEPPPDAAVDPPAVAAGPPTRGAPETAREKPPETSPEPPPPPTPLPVPPTVGSVDSALTWERVYRHDFTDLRDVLAFNSSPDKNAKLSPSDSTNSPLQRPTVRGNVEVVGDAAASDGQALGVLTRRGEYQTPSGTARGWVNGRMMVQGQNHAPPVRVRARVKMTRSAYTKSAVMWWPAGGGWPWEVDFAETFGGPSTTEGWGSRQKIAQRWHADLDGDGRAKEELKQDIRLDATRYHVYDLFITPERMWIEIDGTLRMETTDRRYIPKGKGYFTVGKALTQRRDIEGRTDDAVLVDWVEIYRPR
jgi:hypothetical protein